MYARFSLNGALPFILLVHLFSSLVLILELTTEYFTVYLALIERKLMPRTRLLGIILLLAVSLFGCQSSLVPVVGTDEQVIPFTTIVTEEWGGGYESFEPQLLLLTTAAEVATIEPFVTPEQLAQVRQVDFTQDAVIALFRGVQPSSNHKVVIERITLDETQVTVAAQFWEPAPDQTSVTELTSPYQLVKVLKANLPSSSMQLVLESHAVQP
jgi:hypothetical protein